MGNKQSFASNKYLNTHKKEQKNKEYTSDDQDIGSSRSHSAGSNDMLKYGVKSELQSFAPADCNADENESKKNQASREFDNSSLTTSQQIVSKNKMRESQSVVYHAGNDYRKLSNRGRTPRTRRKVHDFLSTSKILELFPNGAVHFRRECVIQTTNDGGAPRKVAVRTEDGRWKLNCVPTKSFSGVVIAEKQLNELFPFGRIEFRGTVVTHTALNGETREVAIYGEDGRLILLDKVTEELDII